jgi:nucleotide-binding universal stress UspA family protein
MRYKMVVVGTDGSETSLKAVTTAAEIASATSTKLIVVCAYNPMPAREQALITTGLDDTRFRVTGTDAAQEALNTAVATAREAGASGAEGQLVEGDAVNALLTTAEENKPTLLVVGNRGMNRLSGRLLGSVPSDVAFRAKCDVLIAHTTA